MEMKIHPVKTIRIIPFLLLITLIVFTSCNPKPDPAIYYQSGVDPRIELAAKEIQRYVYLRTGVLMALEPHYRVQRSAVAIVLRTDPALTPESYRLTTLAGESELDMGKSGIARLKKSLLYISGGDPQGILYGAYAFAGKLGVRFYLHGDVIPDKMARFRIPVLDERQDPAFSIRGIQPFHDFPEGPDWWSLEDYKGIIGQLVKMKMNFIGFHCYPEGGVGPEPLVWIGPVSEIRPDGTVKSAYPARHFVNTAGTWGYAAKATEQYSHGMGQLFKENVHGAPYMAGIDPWPSTPGQERSLFDQSAAFFREVFRYAHSMGVKTCIGTETPLTIPARVKERFPGATASELYAGMFEWVKRNLSPDYYWFWTPEDWTWGGNSKEELNHTVTDLKAAMKAAEAVEAPFQLATCGWVLGPAHDRAMFDEILPKSWPMSCINQQVGFTPVDPGFARVQGRPLWAIPWLEDDPALTIPQLWAGRMRADAADALAYGCTGLIGIHWRTRPLAMNVSALAQSGWFTPTMNASTNQGEASPELARPEENINYPSPDSNFLRPLRDLHVGDFYRDWAMAEFGSYVADSIASLFSRLDGQERNINAGGGKVTRLPRPADWAGGPGGVVPDTTPWEIRSQDYAFIDKMETWREMIRRPGNRDRFDYWLSQFRYLRAYGKFACTLGKIDQSVRKIEMLPDSLRGSFSDEIIALRIQLMENQTEALTHLMSYLSTPGDLGTVANWQQHIANLYIEGGAQRLQNILGDSLPHACWPTSDTLPLKRVIIPTVRTSLEADESLHLTILLPGIVPQEALVRYRLLGQGPYLEEPILHGSRAVYHAILSHDLVPGSFEYFIEVKDADGTLYRWPSTAGRINQTVIR